MLKMPVIAFSGTRRYLSEWYATQLNTNLTWLSCGVLQMMMWLIGRHIMQCMIPHT